MTPQQKTLILDALRIGEAEKLAQLNHIKLQAPRAAIIHALEYSLSEIRAAIQELEAMPTEEVK